MYAKYERCRLYQKRSRGLLNKKFSKKFMALLFDRVTHERAHGDAQTMDIINKQISWYPTEYMGRYESTMKGLA